MGSHVTRFGKPELGLPRGSRGHPPFAVASAPGKRLWRAEACSVTSGRPMATVSRGELHRPVEQPP